MTCGITGFPNLSKLDSSANWILIYMSYHPFHHRQVIEAGRLTGSQGKKTAYNNKTRE
jgi:hypothetical protein